MIARITYFTNSDVGNIILTKSILIPKEIEEDNYDKYVLNYMLCLPNNQYTYSFFTVDYVYKTVALDFDS